MADSAENMRLSYCRNSGQVFVAPAKNGEPPMDSVVVMLQAVSWLLRRAREHHGWQLVEVAERCGVSPSVLSRVERAQREPHLWLVLRICNVVGVRFSDVMRMAENEAFPVNNNPWTDHPIDLFGPPRTIRRWPHESDAPSG